MRTMRTRARRPTWSFLNESPASSPSTGSSGVTFVFYGSTASARTRSDFRSGRAALLYNQLDRPSARRVVALAELFFYAVFTTFFWAAAWSAGAPSVT